MPDQVNRIPEPRQVVLDPNKEIRRKSKPRTFGTGVVLEPAADYKSSVVAASVQAADLTFPPISKFPLPINFTNKGGAIASALPVQLIFWGSAWNQPSTNPSVSTIVTSVQTILRSPWMSALRQYGVRRCSFGGSIVALPGPPGTFNDSDVYDLIWSLIDGNLFPEPDDPGGANLYMVFMPPGSAYGPGGIRGKHGVASDYDFPADIDRAWVGFALFNTLNTILSAFSHELAEMCTDPESDAWTDAGGNEIGDVCNAVDGPINGVNVESYWSATDNLCIIPTAYSVRRMLKWSGHTLDGKGLLSIQRPIPSLNKLIVGL